MGRRVAACVACLAVLLAPPAAADATALAPAMTTRIAPVGTSNAGRPIRAVVRCSPDAVTDVLVVGVIHGDERAGRAVVRRLAASTPPPRTCWWLVAALNPDGLAAGTRQNRRGVDLNRNFPTGWRPGGGGPFGTYFAGRSAASEPETRAAVSLLRAVRPDVTVWYHQHVDIVVRPPLPWRQRLAAAYARRAAMRLRAYPGPPLHGTASSHQHATLPRSLALVVELPAGALSPTGVARHAAAVSAVSRAAASDAVPPP